jgi:membrane associated rhomboid family serine protease
MIPLTDESRSVSRFPAVTAGGVAYRAHITGIVFGAVTARLFEDSRRLSSQRRG